MDEPTVADIRALIDAHPGSGSVLPMTTVPCVYCREPIPAEAFTFRSAAKRLMTGGCQSCARQTTLSALSWRRWTGRELPIQPLAVSGLSISGRYVPAGPRGEPVAGDFFDVVELTPRRTLIAVGDVSGHGDGAISRMTQLRAGTRAVATDLDSPVEMLHHLDLLQGAGNPEDIATLWLAIYDQETGVLRYTSAGHLPPVVAGFADRTILLREAGAPPLGTGVVREHAPVDEIYLPVGAFLVAYSDGLVERVDRDLDSQIEQLRELVDRTCRPPGGDATTSHVWST